MEKKTPVIKWSESIVDKSLCKRYLIDSLSSINIMPTKSWLLISKELHISNSESADNSQLRKGSMKNRTLYQNLNASSIPT